MADKKISQLSSLTNAEIATDDFMPIVDLSAGPDGTKKIKISELDIRWAGGGSTSPAGSDTQVQFNDSGVFGADAAFTYNKSTNVLDITSLHMVPQATRWFTIDCPLGQASPVIEIKSNGSQVSYITDLGDASFHFANFVTGIDVGNIQSSGGTTVINNAFNPASDNSYDLGSGVLGWRKVYTHDIATGLAEISSKLTLDSGSTIEWDAGSNSIAIQLSGSASTSWSLTLPSDPPGATSILTENTGGTVSYLNFTGTTTDFLRGDGNFATPAVPAAGSDTYIQYNNSGAFAGDSSLIWNHTSQFLTVGGQQIINVPSGHTGNALEIQNSSTPVASIDYTGAADFTHVGAGTFATSNTYEANGSGAAYAFLNSSHRTSWIMDNASGGDQTWTWPSVAPGADKVFKIDASNVISFVDPPVPLPQGLGTTDNPTFNSVTINQINSFGDLQLGNSTSEFVKFQAGDTGGSPSNGITPNKWIAVKDGGGAAGFIGFFQ